MTKKQRDEKTRSRSPNNTSSLSESKAGGQTAANDAKAMQCPLCGLLYTTEHTVCLADGSKLRSLY